jgi:hypothetical protein
VPATKRAAPCFWDAHAYWKFGRDTVRAKRHGLKFASSLDCEGDGHFQELLVTTSHVNDNPARAPANECVPGE